MENYIRKLTDVDFITSEWSGGKTTQLYIYPENSNYNKRDFKARISSATVELEESNFTMLEGVHRFITPLDCSLKLTHDGEKFTHLKPFEVYEFEGDINTTSHGKAKDFNLMLANGAKGELKNFSIHGKEEVIILANFGLNILYSYDSLFRIRIDEEEFMLYPNEILVIKSIMVKHIKIDSDNHANILLCSIIE